MELSQRTVIWTTIAIALTAMAIGLVLVSASGRTCVLYIVQSGKYHYAMRCRG